MCSVCGGLASECQSPESEGRFATEDPIRCHRSTALLQKQAAHAKDEVQHERALIWEAPRLKS